MTMMQTTGQTRLDNTLRSMWVSGLIILMTATVISGCVGEMAAPTPGEECTVKSSRTCFCADGDVGVQSCSEAGALWSECRCSCVPGETEECGCDSGEDGLRACHPSGEFWEPCQCLSEEERMNREIEQTESDPRCSAGENYCPDVGCVSLANSATNCGMCGVVCEGCDRCFRGACTTVCCSDEANCGTEWSPECSDLESDPSNCGACGIECDDREACVRGSCVLQ